MVYEAGGERKLGEHSVVSKHHRVLFCDVLDVLTLLIKHAMEFHKGTKGVYPPWEQ